MEKPDEAGPDGPADTQMMGVVHSALRRDLVRTKLLLGTPAAAEPPRRTALAEHLVWQMDFLHHHHTGEDEGLYPLVVERNPGAAAMVRQMDADHESIAPAMDHLVTAAETHLADPRSPDDLLVHAIDELNNVLLPHLAREETEMMPVVSQSLTDAEWRAWDEEANLKPRGMLQLAVEGHWLLDGLDAASSDYVKHLVPPVPRFILLRLLGGSYRRRRTTLWAGTRSAEVPSLPIGAEKAWV